MRLQVLDKDKIALSFYYDEELVVLLKENFKDRTWDKENRRWIIKLNEKDNIEFLRSYMKPEDYERLRRIYERFRQEIETKIQESKQTTSDIEVPLPPGLSLYPFQKAGVEWIAKNGNVLIADEMGLGKTVQAIAYLNLLKPEEIEKVCIVCPSAVKYNWVKELQKWLVHKFHIQALEGRKDTVDRDAKVVVMNYDIVKHYVDSFDRIDVLVLDESHYIKNPKAERTKAVKALSKKAKKIIALSGTPFLNRPVEIFTTLNILAPNEYKDFMKFALRYCNAQKTKYGWDFSGASNTDELARRLRMGIMLRREKKDVLKELPSKVRTIIMLSPTKLEKENTVRELLEHIEHLTSKIEETKKALENAEGEEKEFLQKALERYKAIKQKVYSVAINEIEQYRKDAALKKLPYVKDFIEDVIEQEKLVVFCYHKDIAQELYETFKDRAVIITGDTSAQERQKAVERFQEDENIRLFVGTIRACSEGITLTRASKVLFVEYDWTPSRMVQAEDRVHRIGQESSVNIYWFAFENTIDHNFITVLKDKMDVFKDVMMQEEDIETFVSEVKVSKLKP